MKLNLGGGGIPIEGYTDLDRKNGQDIYPLAYRDASVTEIRASHVLEHFGHHKVQEVLNEWVRVLEPGGVLKVAVPDFEKIAAWYQEGHPELPLQSYLVGGQTDDNDYHKSVFDVRLLDKCLRAAGLTDIKSWSSEIQDNASMEVSLNLQGTKPRPKLPAGWPLTEAHNIYTQFGEDGILKAIFDEIGVENRFCVDVGAADGLLFSNVRQFIEQGWHGLLIEKDRQRFERLLDGTGGQFGQGQVRCYNYEVGTQGIYSLEALLDKVEAPVDFDLLSIDVDGQEYYIWNALLKYHPRAVVVEYDPQASSPMFIPPLNGKGQAGWNAMTHVAAARGYMCLARTQTNLICVRQDILNKLLASGYKLEIIDPGESEPLIDAADVPDPAKIIAVASVPRLGFNATWHCTLRAVLALHIKMEMVEGVFWGQCLTRGIEKAIDQGADIILTIDYDSVFDVQHVIKLCQLFRDHPEYAAIVPVQVKRECEQILFKTNGSRDFSKPLTPVAAGHFGLTVFDATAFAKLPKPWFVDVPNANGDWGEGRIDCDMHFWQQFERAGLKVALANEVRIGHLELGVTWPDAQFRPVRQSVTEYREQGQPSQCGGDLKVELAG